VLNVAEPGLAGDLLEGQFHRRDQRLRPVQHRIVEFLTDRLAN
jgi:hypothetical protein